MCGWPGILTTIQVSSTALGAMTAKYMAVYTIGIRQRKPALKAGTFPAARNGMI